MQGVEGSLQKSFADYEAFHRTTGNQITHEIGIPLIVVSLLGLLARVSIAGTPLTFGLLFWSICALWYLKFCFSGRRFVWTHFTLVAPYAMVTLGAYFLGAAIPVTALWVLFVLGWISQGIGHFVFEKRSPAFFTNLRHLFVGPFWIFARIFRA